MDTITAGSKLVSECLSELGLTLDGVRKSPHRTALREMVEGVAIKKLRAAVDQEIPKTTHVEMMNASMQNAAMQNAAFLHSANTGHRME